MYRKTLTSDSFSHWTAELNCMSIQRLGWCSADTVPYAGDGDGVGGADGASTAGPSSSTSLSAPKPKASMRSSAVTSLWLTALAVARRAASRARRAALLVEPPRAAWSQSRLVCPKLRKARIYLLLLLLLATARRFRCIVLHVSVRAETEGVHEVVHGRIAWAWADCVSCCSHSCKPWCLHIWEALQSCKVCLHLCKLCLHLSLTCCQ